MTTFPRTLATPTPPPRGAARAPPAVLHGRLVGPLYEHLPEDVGDADPDAAGLERPPTPPRVMAVEVGRSYHPLLALQQILVTLLVEGVVAQGEKVRYLEQRQPALRGDPTSGRRGVLRVGDHGVE